MTRTVPAAGIQPASAEDTRAVFAGLLAFNQAASGDALDDQPVRHSMSLGMPRDAPVVGPLRRFPASHGALGTGP